jgi:hypothetical protein
MTPETSCVRNLPLARGIAKRGEARVVTTVAASYGCPSRRLAEKGGEKISI